MDILSPKNAAESLIVMTELVLPNDSNLLGNLMGGRLLYWMDIASALAASKHSSCQVVTASVDNVSFNQPIKLGSVITIKAKVSRAFKTSMEVHMEVWVENHLTRRNFKSNEAFYTFVALNEVHTPVEVAPVVAVTDDEKRLYEGALRRRQLRLILGGKMKPDEATELKALFIHD
jgi:acyl-CoA hydrolase